MGYVTWVVKSVLYITICKAIVAIRHNWIISSRILFQIDLKGRIATMYTAITKGHTNIA